MLPLGEPATLPPLYTQNGVLWGICAIAPPSGPVSHPPPGIKKKKTKKTRTKTKQIRAAPDYSGSNISIAKSNADRDIPIPSHPTLPLPSIMQLGTELKGLKTSDNAHTAPLQQGLKWKRLRRRTQTLRCVLWGLSQTVAYLVSLASVYYWWDTAVRASSLIQLRRLQELCDEVSAGGCVKSPRKEPSDALTLIP